MRRRSFLALLGLAPAVPALIGEALTSPPPASPGGLVAQLNGYFPEAYAGLWVVDGRVIAVGGEGETYTSSDGVTWCPATKAGAA